MKSFTFFGMADNTMMLMLTISPKDPTNFREDYRNGLQKLQ
jgi:hypothetical protein